jgi:hypothetical protein
MWQVGRALAYNKNKNKKKHNSMEHSFPDKLTMVQLKKFPPSLLCSQGPANGPYPEPDEISPKLANLFL